MNKEIANLENKITKIEEIITNWKEKIMNCENTLTKIKEEVSQIKANSNITK